MVAREILIQEVAQMQPIEVKQAEPKEERSSLLDESMLNESVKPANAPFSFDIIPQISSPIHEAKTDIFEMIANQKPVDNLTVSHFEEKPAEEAKVEE